MKIVFVIFALLSAIYAYDSDEYYDYDDYDEDNHPCRIDGVEDYDYSVEYENDQIYDDHEGPVWKIKKGNITEVLVEGFYFGDDIVASIKGEEIVFEFADDYKNYDFDYETTTRDRQITLKSAITFKCPNGRTLLLFSQPIIDKNNHEPKFNRKVYTYKFGMDVAAGFDLTELIDIYAVDLDFTEELTFSIESNDYLDIERNTNSKSNIKGKLHYASLVLKKAIVGKFDKTFKIYVTDKNEVQHTAEAKVRLIRL